MLNQNTKLTLRYSFINRNLLIILYGLINLAFVYKYGIRQNYINIYILLFAYTSFLIIFYYLYTYKKKLQLKNWHYISLVILFFLSIIGINLYVDGTVLNVDRWSAMDVSINALLNGNYPYTAIDHLGGRTSNLPALLILGIPFYLLHDVGYIQAFSFLLFAYIVFISFTNNKQRFFAILLLLSAPSFMWEVYVKSDLMSNLIFVLSFIVIIHKQNTNNYLSNPYLTGFLSAFIALTRVVVIIPLTIFFMKNFYENSTTKKLQFLLTAILTSGILIGLVVMNCPDYETLIQYNPLLLQTHYTPLLVNLISLALPIYVSFKSKNFDQIILFSIIILLLPIAYSFINALVLYGFNNTIISNAFDISYFGILIPFIIYSLTTGIERVDTVIT